MPNIYLDTETYSSIPIKDGLFKYSEAVEVLIITYALDDGPVQALDMTSAAIMPRDLGKALNDDSTLIWCHNMPFDRLVLRKALGIDLPLARCRCSMVLAYAHSLPGGLDALCAALGIDAGSSKKDGRAFIRLFCVPPAKNMVRGRATRETHPVEWAAFLDYAKQDIVAMRECIRRMPKWNLSAKELALWRLDQTINERGVLVDLEFCRAAVEAAGSERVRLASRTAEMTDGDVQSATQRNALLGYLKEEHGVELADLKAGTLEKLLEHVELPEQVRELMAIRLQASSTSVAKYGRFIKCTSSDRRLRGTLQFGGAARTNRWSGRLVQLHNLSRVPKYLKNQYDFAIETIKSGAVDLVYDNPMEVLGSTVRGALIAGAGMKFCRADLSNIEGRVLAWLAGEQWKVEAFARGDDLYVEGYSRAFNVPVEKVLEDEKAGGQMRLIGKVLELACGFGGAVGAFRKMSQIYGVEVTEERALELVRAWRAANPAIVQFWYGLEKKIIEAIHTPGETLTFRSLKIKRSGNWLRIRLPSGRELCYLAPQYRERFMFTEAGERVEDPHGGISYMGTHQYTRKWGRLNTWSGKFTENIVQALARDVFADGLMRVDAAGYPVVLHVHDEAIAETPDTEEFSGDRVAELLATNSGWNVGLPLAAEGSECKRYRK